MTNSCLCLGAVLVIALVIIAFFAWRRWRRRHGEHFSYATPATPRVNEAVGELFAALRCVVVAGRDFEEQAAAAPEALGLAGARPGVALMTAALERAEQALGGSPPTYANYLAVYRGLASTDGTLLGAAEAYVSAGHAVHQKAGLSAEPSGAEASLGNTLLAMGRQLRAVVAHVHRLGVALDVE